MNTKKRSLIISIMLTIISIVYTLLVKTIDVKPLAANNTDIGFATINTKVFSIFGENHIWYVISKYLIIIPILFALLYAVKGLIQLIKRKSLKKVDKEIIHLGFFFVAVVLVYAFFEVVVINYRPILIDGELEASFPSSHTLLAICLSMGAILMNKKYLKKNDALIANIVLYISMVIITIGRVISGAHWLTDVIGGLLISCTLISYLKYSLIEKEEK